MKLAVAVILIGLTLCLAQTTMEGPQVDRGFVLHNCEFVHHSYTYTDPASVVEKAPDPPPNPPGFEYVILEMSSFHMDQGRGALIDTGKKKISAQVVGSLYGNMAIVQTTKEDARLLRKAGKVKVSVAYSY